MTIIEITKDNWLEYKPKMLNLENEVKNDMIEKGIGDLFFTTGEDIEDYVLDKRHHVYIMQDDNKNVISQVYIIGASSHIQGDYSDLSKYFTMDEGFQEYLKQKVYKNADEYELVKEKVYNYKLKAFIYALKHIYKTLDIYQFNQDLFNEINSKTHFDERTILRRNINRYMTEYMQKINAEELYRQFYYIKSTDLKHKVNSQITESYDKFLTLSKITVYENHIKNKEVYYNATVDNTIELDTYITSPKARQAGIAKILSYVGLAKTIEEFFEQNKSDVLYLSITLHKDNYLSENVANFFGFTDYIDLERRSGIDRHVYMKCLHKNNYKKYLEMLSKKISYFYEFGTASITEEEINNFENEKYEHKKQIIEQIKYRLNNTEIDQSICQFLKSILLTLQKDSKQKDKTKKL